MTEETSGLQMETVFWTKMQRKTMEKGTNGGGSLLATRVSFDEGKEMMNSDGKHHEIDSYTMELPTNGDLTPGFDEGAFVVDARSKKAIMKTARVSFRQFKSWLTTQYIILFIDEPQFLINPPSFYSHIIDTPDEILDKSPNDESPNDALTQALGTPEYGSREKVLENVIKEKKEIATSLPPISLTSKKKVVEEEEMIATKSSISKNEVKASRPMTKEVEVTSEPSNLPI
ncbi:putative serine/threonine-protein kinase nek2 [Cucumis melo var. makuwa]|uniref:Serine/threonine-protein kinase nek2 n=1 Tax=Cucumis melo var. makuwa TaxID=1194695 RepID=A0A5A7SUC4_CUCMM|nr:putative serine/threonine-protein kinase nek2 [Cucumis melo var. makuwa]